MDFDDDGISDILSGSWPGELYFFRGEGKGKFAAGQMIKDKDGKVMKIENASTVFAYDWTSDGVLDLLVGDVFGHVHLLANEGSAKKHAFGNAQKLQAGGKDIQVNHGDSHPTVADWDKDGKPDIVVGAGDGSVVWFRNTGTQKELKLEGGRVLLAAPIQTAQAKGGQRGTRAKVCVTDFNGDGRLDLLVGDFSMSRSEPPELTDADKAAEKEAQAKYQKTIKDLQPYFEEMQKLGRMPPDAAERAEWEKKAQAIRERHKKTLDELQAVRQTLQKFQPQFGYNGFVWLLTAQAATEAGSR